MITELPLLSLIIWLPIVSGILVALLGEKNLVVAKALSLSAALVTLLLCWPLCHGFEPASYQMQFVESLDWITSLNIRYSLGVDGLALPLILLTCLILVVVILAAWKGVNDRLSQYYAAFLIMGGCMNGVFAATDAILFYVFWEIMLLPMFLIIGIWGGPRRVYASVKFFLFTFLGSVFMLVAFIYMYYYAGSFEIADFQQLPLSDTSQMFIFVAFLAAFAVKVPMWPVHTWLPDAHVEAPTGGSVVLAAIMLKMGTYGFVRFSLPITPDASAYFAPMMMVLSLIAVVYIGFVALAQQDMKKLVAYSSIAHMGFVTLGLFLPYMMQFDGASLTTALQDEILRETALSKASLAMQGALVQMISHGFISGAMFLCIGVLYLRIHSREIGAYGGVVNTMPKFAALFMLFAMANAGLPGTSGFVGEFWVILASAQANFWIAAVAATTLILGAAYSLWMYKRVVFGEVQNDKVAALSDAEPRELLILALLAVLVLLVGIWPEVLSSMMQTSVEHLIECQMQSKLETFTVGACL